MDFGTVTALLDTHAVLWATLDEPHLGETARSLIERESPECLGISDMTLLEIAMLESKGRIEMTGKIQSLLRNIQDKITVLPMDAFIAADAMALPLSQADPFDRVIVATARYYKIPLLTRNRHITESGLVEAIW